MCIYFWTLNSILLIYISLLMPLPCSLNYCTPLLFLIQEVWILKFGLIQGCYDYPDFLNSAWVLGLAAQFLNKDSWDFHNNCKGDWFEAGPQF